ncbi:mannitol dehydrogenase family protein [Acuticoccus mangrovi]|uniref:Mannitol dehydrogenase family protein n=1 Tax=Acuticoccus mangrovi TaxID=2796142 RepID=A0A934IJS0_9HYPH|nr:mannitol dehydrogenase family protein [Acuticoccus mangrovi]MBJ3776281.1 mannitol dehydrogenase family protein [Acuticoccus mangrovi]
MTGRLDEDTRLPPTVRAPAYDRRRVNCGVVHIGVGAFHRAHQAVYTDDAIAAEGGDWRILGVSLRRPDAAAALNPQSGLYSLIERGADVPVRVIGSLGRVLGPLATHRGAIMAALTDPATRVVTITVSEKGYGRDAVTGGLDDTDPAVMGDLMRRRSGVIEEPQSLPGLIGAALLLRHEEGVAPFTTLSCDNLPENGAVLHRLVTEIVPRGVRSMIADAAFPSSMVDRITPAATAATRADAAAALGVEDAAAIETEPFSQWVIEDRFPAGRPAWEAGGALFVSDVVPYERMKLRMLNGAHSLIAYIGTTEGLPLVRDVLAVPQYEEAVRAHFAAARATLAPVPGVDLDAYADALVTRFKNPAIAHRTAQIAMDGTEKLGPRIFEPALVALAGRTPIDAFARVAGLWMTHAARASAAGTLDDPRAGEIAAALRGADPLSGLAKAAAMPMELRKAPEFWDRVVASAQL